MEISDKDLEKIIAKQADRVAQESDERMKRYIGAVKEDFNHKLGAVLEYVKDIPAIKEKQDIMFGQMGQMAEDVTIIKEAVKDHETRIRVLERGRKHFLYCSSVSY